VADVAGDPAGQGAFPCVGAAMTRANEVIRRARERLGLTEQEAAARAGLSVDEYGDLEQHADEVVSAVSLATARRVCKTLNIALTELLAAESLLAAAKTTAGVQSPTARPRHKLVQQQRITKGASISDVANAIGFEDAAVKQGESTDDYLESLPIRVLIDWARYVDLDAGVMLAL
jgi:transcriptional regulator with XRE-family HTH domain